MQQVYQYYQPYNQIELAYQSLTPSNYVDCPVLFQFQDTVVSICNHIFNTCEVTNIEQSGQSTVFTLPDCYSVDESWSQKDMVLIKGKFANDNQFALFLMKPTVENQFSLVTYMNPTEPTLPYQKKVSYSFFSLSSSYANINNKLYIAGLVTLYDSFAQLTMYNSKSNEVTDYFIELQAQLVPRNLFVYQSQIEYSDQSIKFLQFLQIDHPVLQLQEDKPINVRFLLTAERFINYQIYLTVQLNQKNYIQQEVNLQKIYPGYGDQVQLPLASYSQQFIVLAYYSKGKITLVAYDNQLNQPGTIFGGIKINSSPYYFNTKSFQTTGTAMVSVFLDEQGQIQNAELKKEVSISIQAKADSHAEISIIALNDYSRAYQNYTLNSNGKISSQTSFKVGWFFFGLFLGIGTLVALYYGYKLHQRRRMNEQSGYQTFQN